MTEYAGIVITFALAGILAGAFILLASVLGPKKPSAVKSEPFECGKVPLSLPVGRLSIKFYLVAILFILFDLEIAFLFPCAVALREIGTAGFVAMMLFLGILVVGFVYEWKKGALEWD